MLRYREAVKAGIRKRMTPPARQSVARISVETERAGENLSAHVPDLSGCILTGNYTSGVKQLNCDAISFYLEGLREHGFEMPKLSWAVVYVELIGADPAAPDPSTPAGPA